MFCLMLVNASSNWSYKYTTKAIWFNYSYLVAFVKVVGGDWVVLNIYWSLISRTIYNHILLKAYFQTKIPVVIWYTCLFGSSRAQTSFRLKQLKLYQVWLVIRAQNIDYIRLLISQGLVGSFGGAGNALNLKTLQQNNLIQIPELTYIFGKLHSFSCRMFIRGDPTFLSDPRTGSPHLMTGHLMTLQDYDWSPQRYLGPAFEVPMTSNDPSPPLTVMWLHFGHWLALMIVCSVPGSCF